MDNRLYFVTSNKGKFEEVKRILGLPIEQLDIDLPEVQSLDAQEIIRRKLLAAEEHAEGNYIVEDTSLYFDCLGGKLPGPLIKWFEKAVGNNGLSSLAKKLGNDRAEAKTLIGYIGVGGEVRFFEGILRGKIVSPRGDKDFGWGPIFEPDGSGKTFGEMEREEKHKISMRSIALGKLKQFLTK